MAFTLSFAKEAAMQLALEWATTNHPEYSLTICTDNQSACTLRALEVTHWKFMPHFFFGQLIKRTHSALMNFSLQQVSLAFVPF